MCINHQNTLNTKHQSKSMDCKTLLLNQTRSQLDTIPKLVLRTKNADRIDRQMDNDNLMHLQQITVQILRSQENGRSCSQNTQVLLKIWRHSFLSDI